MAAEVGWEGVVGQYLIAYVDPWGTLWFIYHLALFLLVTRLVQERAVADRVAGRRARWRSRRSTPARC